MIKFSFCNQIQYCNHINGNKLNWIHASKWYPSKKCLAQHTIQYNTTQHNCTDATGMHSLTEHVINANATKKRCDDPMWHKHTVKCTQSGCFQQQQKICTANKTQKHCYIYWQLPPLPPSKRQTNSSKKSKIWKIIN